MEFKDATMATRTTCRPIPSPLPSPIPPESPRIPCYSRFGDSDQLYQNQILAIPMIILVLASTVGVSFFLFTILKILENYCSRRIYLRRRHPLILFDVPGDSGFSDGDRAAIDYPIFIDTGGLQQSVIDSIPVFNYRKDEGLIEGTECSVCLSEFQEDESLRLLPKCSHAFHIPCIDAWLISHKNCPLCRAPIVQDTGGTERSVIVANLNVSGQDEETRIENFDGESSREDDSGIFPNEDGDVTEASEANSPNHDVMRLHSPIVKDMAIQPVRRSASVDSCSASMKYPALVDLDCDIESSDTPLDDRRNSCGKSIAISKQGSGSSSATYKLASIGRAIQKRPISLKSSSSHGRKFQFSRHSRSQSSTLPL